MFIFFRKKRHPGLVLRIPSVEDAAQEVPTGHEYGSSTPSCGLENGSLTPLDDVSALSSNISSANDASGEFLKKLQVNSFAAYEEMKVNMNNSRNWSKKKFIEKLSKFICLDLFFSGS